MENTSKMPISRVDELLDVLQNIQTKLNSMIYIKETYTNGSDWYRVHSDGWIEQGGYIYNPNDSEVTTTFLKPFTTNNYFITQTTGFNGLYNTNVSGIHLPASILRTSPTNFVFRTFSADGLNTRKWYACGY